MAGAGSNLDQNAPKFFSVAHLNIYNQKQGVLNEYWQNDVFWATLLRHLISLGLEKSENGEVVHLLDIARRFSQMFYLISTRWSLISFEKRTGKSR